MVVRDHPALSLSRQCRLLSVGRSSLYYEPKGESAETLAPMRRIDELFLKYPFYGARRMALHLRREGVRIGRFRAGRLMRLMGLQAIWRAPRTSDPHPEHRVYPYLLRGLGIERANHVWCADITYIPVQRGFLYLVAIMDWASRFVLAWRLSNTLDASFCTDALDEALARHGKPEILNTDQGSQFKVRFGVCPDLSHLPAPPHSSDQVSCLLRPSERSDVQVEEHGDVPCGSLLVGGFQPPEDPGEDACVDPAGLLHELAQEFLRMRLHRARALARAGVSGAGRADRRAPGRALRAGGRRRRARALLRIPRSRRRGVWRGEFVEPSSWRFGVRLTAAAASGAGDCRIKGNISQKGTLIFHVPGGDSYAKTRIDGAPGERWFCSEAEARAARWRRAKR